MPSTGPEHVAVGRLADQAAHAIRLLNHHTRPTTGGLADPLDTAEIIAALASMSGMLPQLLGQLAHWLEAEHHGGRLHVDALAPLPDLAQTVHALTGSLQHAIHSIQRAAEELDTAHQHAAHLATANQRPPIKTQSPRQRGQNPCRSVGPSHLTKHSRMNTAGLGVSGLGV